MTNHLSDRLAAELAVCEGATGGPWTLERPNGDPEEVPSIIRYHITNGGKILRGTYITEGVDLDEDAEFIASARTGYPKALRALQAVMELHQPMPVYDDECGDSSCEREHVEVGAGDYYHPESIGYWSCTECASEDCGITDYPEWPCDTVKAIQEVHGDEPR